MLKEVLLLSLWVAAFIGCLNSAPSEEVDVRALEELLEELEQTRRLQELEQTRGKEAMPVVEEARREDTKRDEIASTSSGELARSLHALTRQSLMQQFYVNQRVRSEGDSGIKQMRIGASGTRPYHADDHSGWSVAAIHNHPNYRRTLGMGEFVAVLNGVEFRTRHNDYKLNSPSKTSSEYRAVEDIPLPQVPPSVLAKPTVAEQVAEMREYFKAWATQDSSLRDYKPYFKPVLSYMEGAWTKSTHSIQESFASDRHNLAADTWPELFDLERFNAYSGNKDLNENFAFLPTAIFDVVNGTFPLLAQWNYRILCHELPEDLPLDRFRPVEDLGARLRWKRNMQGHVDSRAARFQLNPIDRSTFFDLRTTQATLLDKLMAGVPGMDNYGANLEDRAYGLRTFSVIDNKKLNAANYHRMFKTGSSDASGQSKRYRGFSDANMFVAMTTQDDVVGMTLHDCHGQSSCAKYPQKFSYAIPLEIIYMTPLTNWNPYNLKFHDSNQVPTAGGKNGLTPETALDGTSEANFFWTPAEFFNDNGVEDTADTAGGDIYVLDPKGIPQKVRASGHKIHINIDGVGHVRQRFPVMPLHGEGSMVMKELTALTDIVLDPSKYQFVMNNDASVLPDTTTQIFMTSPSSAETGSHVHMIEVDLVQWAKLEAGSITDWIDTSTANGHSHAVKLRSKLDAEGAMVDVWMQFCGSLRRECADGHSMVISRADDPDTV